MSQPTPPGASRPLPIFDKHHPPAPELIDDCVHCGFCLPTCPTYSLWGEEMDSPRGRIVLMSEALEGNLSGAMVQHWDRCLGCMACVTACPSGVKYDKLIEDTRAQVERNHRRTLRDRLGAERRGLRGARPAPAALLRRAADAHGLRLHGPRTRDHRGVRALRPRGGERGRLRLVDEGLRPPDARRPAVGRARAGVLRE